MALKGRNWAFVMYPESMPSNWREIITETGLPCAISPLHDHDREATGESKKPHYHVICYYENTTTQKSVKESVTDRLNATIPIKLESMVGMYRYHLHLDNPEKYQYDDRFRELLNGFDVNKVNALSYTEIGKILKEIQRMIIDNDFREYSDLMDALLSMDSNDFWDVARNHTVMLNTYITSRRNSIKEKM